MQKAKFSKKSIIALSSIGILGLMPSAAFAQVVYSRLSVVPALEGPLLLVLAALLGAVAYWVLRNKSGRNLAAAAVLGLGAAFSSIHGFGIISDSLADVMMVSDFDQPGGGAFPIGCGLEIHDNLTGVTLRVDSVTYPDICAMPRSAEAPRLDPGDECVAGYVLAIGGSCYTQYGVLF